MQTAVVSAALLGLLVFGLGFAVSALRGRANRVIGQSDDPADPLFRLVRAHANATEYAPMLALLILLAGARDPAGWVVVTMWVAVVARYLHAAGMLMGPGLDQVQPLRFAGAVGTYLAGLALCVAALLGGGS